MFFKFYLSGGGWREGEGIMEIGEEEGEEGKRGEGGEEMEREGEGEENRDNKIEEL